MQAVAVKSQLQQIARPMYSNPPLHGALIVSTILGDPALKTLWLKEVKVNYTMLLPKSRVQSTSEVKNITESFDNY
jgi:aspartate/tyrosine/aromatic aminotransferase